MGGATKQAPVSANSSAQKESSGAAPGSQAATNTPEDKPVVWGAQPTEASEPTAS